MKKRTIRTLLSLLALAAGFSLDAGAHSGSVVDGVLTHLVGDKNPEFGSPQSIRLYNVMADDGHVVPVDLSGATLPPGGIFAALNRRVRVTADPNVQADQLPGNVRFPAVSLRVLDANATAPALDVFPLSGNRKYISLLCKFSDVTGFEPRTPSYFQTQLGNAYPGFNHYFQEVSYGRANITGSNATVAWVNLPHPSSFYDNGTRTTGQYLQLLGQECITAAEASVNFAGYVGINIMLNGPVDSGNFAWGGTMNFTIEGVPNQYVSTTWMPYYASGFGWGSHSVLAHELSHSFGSPHSDDPQGYEYGNFWDAVSAPAGNFAACPTAPDANYGCVAQHEVAHHKLSYIIPAEPWNGNQAYVSGMDFMDPVRVANHTAGGATATYNIERAAQPPNAGGTHQVLKIATANAFKYYTVESRKRVGYDTNLPGDGVLIMEVRLDREPNPYPNPPHATKGNPARLLTPTGSTGANLGALASRWSVGDVYVNVADNVKITVVSIDGTGTAAIKVEPASAVTPGEFSFVTTTTEAVEGAAAGVTIAVTRSAPFTGAGSVVWTTSDGTAVAGTDFGTLGSGTQKTGTLTWTAGTGGTKNITVGLAASNIPIINDTDIEAVKSFGITLSSPTGGVLGAQTTHTVNITDSDSTIAFDGGTASVSEVGPNITVTLTRSGSTGVAQAVTYTTTAGTATATSDYTTTTGTITFAIGETSKVITIGPTIVAAPFVRIIDDTTIEGPETFTITLSAPTNGASLGAPAAMTITINSDENGVSMATANRGFVEGVGAQQIMVNRAGSNGAVSVNYAFVNGTAVNGVNYTGTGGTLNWADGETGQKAIDVTIGDDGAPNANRTFTVQLSGATGATLVAPMATATTITDNENTVQFTVASATVAEGTANLVLTVSRTGFADGQGASVTWTANDGTAHLGTDFGGPGTGTLTWPINNTVSQPINIPIINDLLVQGARTFSVSLSAPTGPNVSIGTNSNVNVTLNDNDKGLQFEFPTYSVNEGPGAQSAVIRVQRIGPTTTAATAMWTTVNGTAVAGQDFGTNGNPAQRTGSLSWAIGDTAAKTITIPIVNDDLGGEGDETFTVVLTPGAGYVLGPNAVATVTIHDDDIPPETNVQFSQPKYVVMENGLNAILTVTRTNIGPVSALASSVNYATAPGTALATSDYLTKTGTLNWLSGDFTDKQISIAIVNNTTPEPPESFKVTLSATNPGTGLGTPNQATVLIIDDDEAFPLDGAMPAGFTTPVSATKGWHVSNDPGAFEGAFSLKSDEIDDNETAGLEMNGTFAAGNVSFRVKVSTEPTFDTLQFFIDGVLKGTWSGVTPTTWQVSATYPVSAAHHTLSWVYTKDGSASVGMDAVYLDGLVTPAFVPDP